MKSNCLWKILSVFWWREFKCHKLKPKSRMWRAHDTKFKKNWETVRWLFLVKGHLSKQTGGFYTGHLLQNVSAILTWTICLWILIKMAYVHSTLTLFSFERPLVRQEDIWDRKPAPIFLSKIIFYLKDSCLFYYPQFYHFSVICLFWLIDILQGHQINPFWGKKV